MPITAMTFIPLPEEEWKLILDALRLASAEDLGHLAAGPIEGMLGQIHDV